jgi:homoserine kinase type II
MAVYTDVTDEELATLLADYDLGVALSFKGVAEGVENSNFLLETQTGRYFLTLFERRVREDELPYFLGLMRWLADRGYPTAAPVVDRGGNILKRVRGKPAAIVAFLSGLSVRRPSVAHCREAGQGLAKLHDAAKGYPGRRANDLGHGAWAPMFAKLEGAADHLKSGLADRIRADLDDLAGAWPSDLPAGPIHADYFPDNVFFRSGRFAACFDFYFACDDALAYDIGVALNAWCFEADGAFNVTAAQAFIAGYQQVRPLSPAEREALPILARGAAMRFFLTRLHDWGPVPAGALVRPKDPLEYERKLAVHREACGLPLFPV